MEDKKITFPFRTLIWALFATIALFVFKNELKGLLTDAEKVSVFGVEINASKEKVTKLHDSIQNFESTVASLSNQITDQQNKLKALDELKAKLESDLANCPDAKNSAVLFNSKFDQILTTNNKMKTKSDNLKDITILKRSNLVSP